MGKLSRTKGANFEREIVAQFKREGIYAERLALLQTNKDLDYPDITVKGLGDGELKRRANGGALFYEALDGANFCCFRADGKKSLIIFELDYFIMVAKQCGWLKPIKPKDESDD